MKINDAISSCASYGASAASRLRRRARAICRLAGMAALMAVILPAQMIVAAPLLRDHDTLPRLADRGLRHLLGLKIALKGVQPEKGEGMIYIANHLSWVDPIMMGNVVSGAPVSRIGGVLSWARHLGKPLGIIFVRQGQHGKSLPEIHEKVVMTLNSGRNIILFPEGKSSDGTGVLPFKGGVLTVMLNNASGVKLEKEVRVQPYAACITHVDGQEVAGAPALKEIFSWYSFFTPANLWTILQKKDIRIELTALTVMNPKDYVNREQFVAAAEKAVRDRVESGPRGPGRQPAP